MWTSPADLKDQVQKWWDRGLILASMVTGEELFPRRLVLKVPSSTDMLQRFDEARTWARQVQGLPFLRIEMREARHRVLGTNAMPAEAWVDRFSDAVALLRRDEDVKAFAGMIEALSGDPRLSPLHAWLAQRPICGLELAPEWPALLSVVTWMLDHPRPGIFLRQVDLPGVHTKLIESRAGIIGELLDLTLPEEFVDRESSSSQFARRYGFREKPDLVRMRILDPAIRVLPHASLPDLTLDVESIISLGRVASRVFITENETNFLAFPPMRDSVVIFGAGYGFRGLGRVRWLHDCQILYWGDLDTHGFAILDELRSHFGHVASFLMDRETLLAFKDQWGRESAPSRADMPRLAPMERELLEDIREGRLQPALRLEQERVGFDWVTQALDRLGGRLALSTHGTNFDSEVPNVEPPAFDRPQRKLTGDQDLRGLRNTR